jgi:hypothetical protein
MSNEPAFPRNYSADGHNGMTLRDYFAGEALPMAWAEEQKRPTGPYSLCMEPTYKGIAQRAYHMADAMLAERQLAQEPKT